MKYKIHNIDKQHQCRHEIWGITCDRALEIVTSINQVAKKLNETKDTNFSDVFKGAYKVAKNDGELMFISFYLGGEMELAERAIPQIDMKDLMKGMGGAKLMEGLKEKKKLPN